MTIRDSRSRFASRIANRKVSRALRGVRRSLLRGRIFLIVERGRPVLVFAGLDQLSSLVERKPRHRTIARRTAIPLAMGQP